MWLLKIFICPLMLVRFYATAEMRRFWRSLSRQSKPSTLTVAAVGPNLERTHPLRADEGVDGDIDRPDGIGSDGTGSFSSPKRASWTNGLAARLGGDPQKKGGDEATWLIG